MGFEQVHMLTVKMSWNVLGYMDCFCEDVERKSVEHFLSPKNVSSSHLKK